MTEVIDFYDMVKNEKWLPIRDAPNYLISNYGRVLSKARNYKYGYHDDILLKLSDRKGYEKATLYINGKRCYKSVHRLVAEAFIPNPDNYPVINHKDGNRKNNKANNLEWCTYLYNSRYGDCREKISKKVSRKVEQLTKEGELIKIWDSMTIASKSLSVSVSEISKCCKDFRYSAGGFKWRKVKNE